MCQPRRLPHLGWPCRALLICWRHLQALPRPLCRPQFGFRVHISRHNVLRRWLNCPRLQRCMPVAGCRQVHAHLCSRQAAAATHLIVVHASIATTARELEYVQQDGNIERGTHPQRLPCRACPWAPRRCATPWTPLRLQPCSAHARQPLPPVHGGSGQQKGGWVGWASMQACPRGRRCRSDSRKPRPYIAVHPAHRPLPLQNGMNQTPAAPRGLRRLWWTAHAPHTRAARHPAEGSRWWACFVMP